MKKTQFTSQDFKENHAISSVLAYSDKESLPALNQVAIYAACPHPVLSINDYINIEFMAVMWAFTHSLWEVVRLDLDFSNVDFDSIENPRERQMAKFLFKDNDPSALAKEFDEVIKRAFFKLELDSSLDGVESPLKNYMQLLQCVQAVSI